MDLLVDSLEIKLLGSFRMKRGETSLTDAATDKTRALLTFLALEGMQPRTSLTALLWPYLPQEMAFDNLRKTLYRLRQRLDELAPGSADLLISSRQSLQLDPQRIVVDVGRLQTLLVACDQHAHKTLATCDECLARLAEAVDLYQGELLAGFGLSDAPAFEEWLMLRRESLQHQVLLALAELTTAWETRGDFVRAQSYCSRALMLDPLREEMHRQLMRLLVRLGQRTQAIQQYEACRRVLREELGVDPDPATVALYEQIRRGDPLPSTLPSPLEQKAPPIQAAAIAYPVTAIPATPPQIINPLKWGEIPETGRVYGREAELVQLHGWLSTERCQLVAILGIGGVGKTTLAAAVANAVANDFDKVIWRSLINAPPLDELLRGVLGTIARQPIVELPASLDEQLALLLNEMRQQRQLLVLDNLESILQPEGIGQMIAGYEGYSQLLRRLAESRHNSTLLLTSRERPQGMARWEEDLPWVRCLRIEGLDATAGQAILKARGLGDQAVDGYALVQRYSGHPLALKLVAETIQELFAGDIGAFLASEVVIFDDIRNVLDQQFERLPLLEQEILFWLSVEREPLSLEALRANLVPIHSMQEVVQALRALQRRSLVQLANRPLSVDGSRPPTESWIDAKFASPNVIMEYLVERLIETACREIEQEQLFWLHKHALMQAQALEYIRQYQMRLILQPVAGRLEALLGRNSLGLKALRILHTLRAEKHPPRGYAAGNLLNLLLLLEIDVGALDLAGLSIWQADLRHANLAGSNLAGADLTGSRFADAFSVIRAVAVSPDGRLVAGGTVGAEIRLWDAENGRLIQVYRGHKGPIRSLAFRPDGKVLASGSEDRSVRLWSIEGSIAGRDGTHSEVAPYARLLEGHSGRVTSVVFHPDGKSLISGSVDSTVRIWDVASGETRAVLHGHESWVSVVAMSPDGRTVASGGYDRIIRLWDLQTTEVRATLTGHKELVSSLAFDQSGARLASGSYDRTLCVWDVAGGQMIYSIEAATDLVTCVAFSHDGERLASGSDDTLIRVWDARTATLTTVLHEHRASLCGVVFSPDGQTLISGGADHKLCLWDLPTSRISRLFSGHSRVITSLAFHPDGKMLASGHYDHLVRLWELDKQEVRQVLHGHALKVNSLAFSADGTQLASGSDDQSIQVWTVPAQGNARRRTLLRGHQRNVVAVDFHPDGKTLLSASEDQTVALWNLEESTVRRSLPIDDLPIRAIKVNPTGTLWANDSQEHLWLWDMQSAALYAKLKGHATYVSYVAFSPDGHWLATGGTDGTIGLWDVRDPARVELKRMLPVHSDRIFVVAFHPNGSLLASGSADYSVRLWDMERDEVVHTLRGHTNWVWTLAFSPDGSIIASGGMDETIRLWDSQSGEALAVLHPPGPYAGMNISGARGISDGERTTLKLLGAIEQ